MYYVIKKSGGFTIWEGTPSQLMEFTARDPSLSRRLDRTPFDTRAEAESRIRYLIAHPPRITGGRLSRRDQAESDADVHEAKAPSLSPEVEKYKSARKGQGS